MKRFAFLAAVSGLAATTCLAADEAAVAPAMTAQLVPASEIEVLGIESWDQVLERQAQLGDIASNPKARNGAHGTWVVPSERATFERATSGEQYVTNKWGDTLMGISFNGVVDVDGASFGGQGGGPGVWAAGVRFIGYRDGRVVGETDFSEALHERSIWVDANLKGVDRIVIESLPVHEGAGFFTMDDLTFVRDGQTTVVTFDDVAPETKITGKDYAGLTWEEGAGPFNAEADQALPPPRDLSDSIFDPTASTEDPQAGINARGAVPAPLQLLDFQGVKRGDQGQSSYPPDTCGAIGPNHFLEVVNTVWAVYDRNSGGLVTRSSLSSFQPGTSGDPRVLYDAIHDRWIVVSTNFGSNIYVAYSLTNNPTGSWFKFSFNAATGSNSGCGVDYPTLGYDDRGIYIAAFMYNTCGYSIFAIDKSTLLAGSPSVGNIWEFHQIAGSQTTQPCEHLGAQPGVAYFAARASSNQIRKFTLTGALNTGSAPVLTNNLITIASHTSPPTAPALGASTNLDTVGSRLMNAVYRNGSIWTAHAINVGGRSAVRWYQLDANSNSVSQFGTISDPTYYYFDPGITVNSVEAMVVGFSGSHAGVFAGAFYAGRRGFDSSGATCAPVEYKVGEAAQNLIDSFGRNRWGDYSLVTVDPNDDMCLWCIQEYSESPANIWGTWILQLSYDNDCNGNMVDDLVDIAMGTSQDSNGNNVPDECEPFPDPFNLTNPADGAMNVDAAANINFLWTASNPGVTYNITISANSDLSSPIVNQVAPSGFLTLGGGTLSGNTQYYWGVTATDSQSRTTQSTPYPATFTTASVTIDCDGDADGDGSVTLQDLNIVLFNFGNAVAPGTNGDVDGDGNVTLNDLNIVLFNFGNVC